MKIHFIAPRFDQEGNKISNARFKHVLHNGILIQEDVEVSGSTNGGKAGEEVKFAPFLIQGDHGNVAFRNFKYKAYTLDTIALSNLTYEYFEHEGNGDYVAFDSVKILKTGNAPFFDVDIANEADNDYGLIFKGSLKRRLKENICLSQYLTMVVSY